MELQQGANFPCHLTIFWPDEQTAEWFEVVAAEILRAKFREGCLKVPGFSRTDGWEVFQHIYVIRTGRGAFDHGRNLAHRNKTFAVQVTS